MAGPQASHQLNPALRGRGAEVGWGEEDRRGEERRGEERKRDGEGLPPLEWRSGYAPAYYRFYSLINY